MTPTRHPPGSKLSIHDWEKWQSYRKDRGTPPWIKVHRCLFSCEKWGTLSDAQKGQLVSMWVAAADNNGTIPADPRIIKKICQLDTEPDIELFQHLQLLEVVGCHLDANTTPTRRQHDAPETETETEKNPPTPRKREGNFTPPDFEEVKTYCLERKNSVDPERFVDFYACKGWMVGKNKMKDWRAAVRNWEKDKKENKQSQPDPPKFQRHKCTDCKLFPLAECPEETRKRNRGCPAHENAQ